MPREPQEPLMYLFLSSVVKSELLATIKGADSIGPNFFNENSRGHRSIVLFFDSLISFTPLDQRRDLAYGLVDNMPVGIHTEIDEVYFEITDRCYTRALDILFDATKLFHLQAASTSYEAMQKNSGLSLREAIPHILEEIEKTKKKITAIMERFTDLSDSFALLMDVAYIHSRERYQQELSFALHYVRCGLFKRTF